MHIHTVLVIILYTFLKDIKYLLNFLHINRGTRVD